MIYSNALPKGENQGEVSIIAFRGLGLDGHSAHTLETIALTPHALFALNQLTGELIAELSADTGTNVAKLKRHG